jgi:hypothetical protein
MIRLDKRVPTRAHKPAPRRSQLRTRHRRLVWLLSFADQAGQLATLDGRALERLRFEVWSFPVRIMTSGGHDELSGARIADLAAKVRHGIRTLLRGETWHSPIGSQTLYLTLKDGRPHSRYSARHVDGFLVEAYELIAAEAQRLRQCQRSKCPKVFAANKRQVFCSPRCAQDQRTERFLMKQTKEERSARRHARYVAQIKRTKGDAVAKKVRRRQRGPVNNT